MSDFVKTLQTRKDCLAIVTVQGANPNGDPLAGNMPRMDLRGHGEMTAECIKHKLRRRLYQMNKDAGDIDVNEVLVLPADEADDRYTSILNVMKEKRGGEVYEILTAPAKTGKKGGYTNAEKRQALCESWRDVRAFGFLVAGKMEGSGVSIGIRGPVSVQAAKSIAPIQPVTMQITKSVSFEAKDGKRGSDTMGKRYHVDCAAYVIKLSISCTLAEKTGFTEEDAEAIKQAMATLFEGDESSARPVGTMAVTEMYWWDHNTKLGQYPLHKVFGAVDIKPSAEYPYYTTQYSGDADLPGLRCDILHPQA